MNTWSSYTEDFYQEAQAVCPKCEIYTACRQVKYTRLGDSVHLSRLYHPECETFWEIDFLRNTKKVIEESE